MADFKWYEQYSVCWADGSSTEEPSDDVMDAVLHRLEKDGWHDDPTLINSNCWVYVRRLYKPAKQATADAGTEALSAMGLRVQAVAEQVTKIRQDLSTKNTKCAEVLRIDQMEFELQRLRDEVNRLRGEVDEHPVTVDEPLVTVLDTELRGTKWELTIKGGTRKV